MRWRRWARRLVWAGLVLVLLPLLAHQHVVWSAASHIYSVEDAPERPIAIVLGASVRPDGNPSHMLADRLATAAALYARGKVRRVLVSGSADGGGYDEPAAMRRALIEHGVPSDAILLDRHGDRTLDSVYRAHTVFGVDSALVVSNPFHVARAVFLGRRHGIDLAGVAAEHGSEYRWSTLTRHRAREFAARVLAWLDVFVLGTEPEQT